MANIAEQRIRREFKEVVKSEEVRYNGRAKEGFETWWSSESGMKVRLGWHHHDSDTVSDRTLSVTQKRKDPV
jgi:hypothetical protein